MKNLSFDENLFETIWVTLSSHILFNIALIGPPALPKYHRY